MRLSLRRSLFAFAVFSALPLLVACPKKNPEPVDAAPPPPLPEPVDSAPAPLEPLVEDAGEDADADADADAAKKVTAVSPNVTRLKQCCQQLRVQAKAMGPSPEAGMFTTAANQCDATAKQMAAGGTAPELAIFKTLLAGRNMPAVCSGF